jgi:hypothetical protein
MVRVSSSATVPWIKVDERVYVDVMSVEVLLIDFSEQLEDEDDPDGAEAVRRIAGVLAALSEAQRGEIRA